MAVDILACKEFWTKERLAEFADCVDIGKSAFRGRPFIASHDIVMLTGYVEQLQADKERLTVALIANYEFTKYAGANKQINTDEYIKEFFIRGESAQKKAEQALQG